jgi:hypothetical protein
MHFLFSLLRTKSLSIFRALLGGEREAGHHRHHREEKLQWYGHVKSMPEERMPKLILEWVPEERRKRGRPRKT